MFKYLILVNFLILGSNSFNQYASITCQTSFCKLALDPCVRCFGVYQCKKCILSVEKDCLPCADEIYAQKNVMIGRNQFQMCHTLNDLSNKICHMFCRGYFYETGSCQMLNDIFVCQCSNVTNPYPHSTLPTVQDLNIKFFTKLTISPKIEAVKIKGLPNGHLAFGNMDIFIYDVLKEKIVQNLTSDLDSIQSLDIQSNGNLVAMSRFVNHANFWNPLENTEPVKNLSLNGSCLRVLQNDDLVVCQMNQLKIIDSLDGSEKITLFGHEDLIYCVLALEYNSLVSGSKDGSIKLWDIENDRLVREFNSSESSVTSLAVLKNGNLVSGHSNGMIKVWNRSGDLNMTINGHSDAVSCLTSLNNRYLISGSFDRFFKVWDLYDQSEKFNCPSSPVYGMEYFGNGKTKMIKNIILLCLIKLILCQQQQPPLPSPSFGRVFRNLIKTRNFYFNDNNSICTNPAAYGFVQRAGTAKYYATADLQMNWIDAENYCQFFGAHLPVAADASDNNFFRWFVGGKFMNPSYENIKGYSIMSWSGYWLGAYKSLETNSWKWIDNSPFLYEDWDKTWPVPQGPQPGEHDNKGLEHNAFDLYDISLKKHRGWHDLHMQGYNLVLCELKC
ncbi:serine threonine kinase [Brachionus plicatilis]|uniref:Serine threonine kinase n=1 Tax=Brachionus plicatilis TaxID=10195 RepID=A0A3M7RYC9_BRAPC|nr:serine threonine kinase [Brachionus plicatilis]